MNACLEWNFSMIGSALILAISASANVLIWYKTWKSSQRVMSFDSSWRDVVNAAVAWQADFGTSEHPMAIAKLREAVYAMQKREREILK